MLLTPVIEQSQNPNHGVLANRALVRTRLRKWNEALADAEKVLVALLLHFPTLTSIYTKSIKIHPSIFAYIAMGIANVGVGERDNGYQACDIAFKYVQPSDGNFLRLIKACSFPFYALLSCSYSLGRHHVYGGRSPRCDSMHGRPHRYSPLQLDILRGSGVCIALPCAVNTTAGAFNRPTCIFSLEIHAWRAATMRVR